MELGTLHSTIRRLHQSGLVEESDERPDAQFADQRHRYYCLTDLGHRALSEEIQRLDQFVILACRKSLRALPSPDIPQEERMNKGALPALATLLIATGLLTVAGQTQPATPATPAAPTATATATLRDAQGNTVGTATLTEQGAVTVQVTLKGFTTAKAGEHGIHLHAVGQCAPTFAAAGGHFNPASHKHGFLNKDGHHAGDLPNLMVDAQGNSAYQVTTDLVTLSAGPNSLFDQDGSSIVIHAGPDDYRSDPAGNSGDRIACGVITRQP